MDRKNESKWVEILWGFTIFFSNRCKKLSQFSVKVLIESTNSGNYKLSGFLWCILPNRFFLLFTLKNYAYICVFVILRRTSTNELIPSCNLHIKLKSFGHIINNQNSGTLFDQKHYNQQTLSHSLLSCQSQLQTR